MHTTAHWLQRVCRMSHCTACGGRLARCQNGSRFLLASLPKSKGISRRRSQRNTIDGAPWTSCECGMTRLNLGYSSKRVSRSSLRSSAAGHEHFSIGVLSERRVRKWETLIGKALRPSRSPIAHLMGDPERQSDSFTGQSGPTSHVLIARQNEHVRPLAMTLPIGRAYDN